MRPFPRQGGAWPDRRRGGRVFLSRQRAQAGRRSSCGLVIASRQLRLGPSWSATPVGEETGLAGWGEQGSSGLGRRVVSNLGGSVALLTCRKITARCPLWQRH